MNKSKKQPVKKRPYKKRADKWTNKDSVNAIRNIQFIEPVVMAPKLDAEIQELTAIVSIFDNWSDDQKIRGIRFIASRYWAYLNNDSKI